MEMWIATGNKGKLNEFKLLLERDIPDLKIHSTAELPSSYSSPIENGTSFLDNARIKAKSLKAMKPKTWVLADDSGLIVNGLDGLPGVHSSRYAGPKASDSENVAKLLKMMQIRCPQNRSAHFHCTMVVYTPQGEEIVFLGNLNGEIAKANKGHHGFGYDPVFIPEGETLTLSELGAAYKNKNSHRAQASLAFIEYLKQTNL